MEEDISSPAQGAYSTAIRFGDTVYVSGQLPLDNTGRIVSTSFSVQAKQAFENLLSVLSSLAGANTGVEVVKLSVFITDIENASIVDDVMKDLFQAPYPARTLVAVNALPRQAMIEVDAIMHLGFS